MADRKESSPFIKRAETSLLKAIFEKYASVEHGGERWMTHEDFMLKFLQLFKEENEDRDELSLKLLANCVDTTKDGFISFTEFQAFESLLCEPDAVFALAFQLFDTDSSGYITLDEFKYIISHTEVHQSIPFNFETEFTRLYFGTDGKRRVTYAEFTQLLYEMHEEHALQAFRRADKDKDGLISTLEFHKIMSLLKSHLLTSFVKENLIAVCGSDVTTPGPKKVSYPFFLAFISLLNHIDIVSQVYKSASLKFGAEITREEFLHEAQQFSQITPLEVDILFRLLSKRHSNGRLSADDILALSPFRKGNYRIQAKAVQEKVHNMAAGKGRSVMVQVAESGYRFFLGSIAGCVGAFVVYPIDLVKTRLQNQRVAADAGEVMYRNSFDCFRKVLKFEGIPGLYRGLAPQLVGVAPEKAIKLTVNDLVRDKLRHDDGTIALWAEILAGGCAGGSQVLFTNPLEIVKIRLQTAGETGSKVRAGGVIRDLGLLGLYKGSRACFARDIPFSMIYFTSYAHLKKTFASADGTTPPSGLLLAATISGAPSACLTTPFDVVKTRLQVVARKGQTTYSGMTDCARKVFKEEGAKAFWKGAPARMLRSSPQFGFTLLTYELLQRVFYVDFGGSRPIGSPVKPTVEERLPRNPDHIGGYRLAVATFQGIETTFGLNLPKFKRPDQMPPIYLPVPTANGGS